jgi:RND family efflux transporter MFP subunit
MTKHAPISTAVILTLLSLGCGGGESDAKKPAAPQAVAVKTAAAQISALPRNVELPGTLYGDEETQISAKVAGRIVATPADVGDRVAAGQLLAQVDPVDYDLAVALRQNALAEALARLGIDQVPGPDFDPEKTPPVERARYQSENAQAKLDRAKRLFEQQPPLISEQDYADLQTAYEVALRDLEVAKLDAKSLLAAVASRKSELDSARQQAADTRIVAPAAAGGREYAVSQRSVSVGEYVSPATATFRLVLDDPIKFRGFLPERYAQQVKVGQPIRVRIDGLDQPAAGRVSRVNPAIDIASRSFEVEALLPNADRRLRPGAFGRGEIEVGVQENVVMVPEAAVYSFAGLDKVFTVKDGKAVEHRVLPGVKQNGYVALNVDLGGASDVVVTNVDKIANGSAVESSPATQPAK